MNGYYDLRKVIGKVGVAKTDISPKKTGVVWVEAEMWSALSDEEIKAGEKVKVIDIKGLTLVVKRA